MRARVSNRRLAIAATIVLGALAHSHPRAGEGMEVYLHNCAVCHGNDGAGAMPGVPDLSQSTEWLQQDTEQLVQRIQQGIQSPNAPMPMPPNAGNPELTAQQLEAVVVYLKDMVQNKTPK